MFRALGSSFLEIFKKPFIFLWIYVVMTIFAFISSIFFDYTYDLNTLNTVNTSFLYLIKNNIFLFLANIVAFLFFGYVACLIIAYIYNKKSGSGLKFKGASKLFGFYVFLSLLSVLPSLVLQLVTSPIAISLFSIVYFLIYALILFPIFFLVPVYILDLDITKAFSKAFAFSKANYWSIILFEILFSIMIYVVTYFVEVFSSVSIYASFFVSTLFFTIILLWLLYFIYNWVYP